MITLTAVPIGNLKVKGGVSLPHFLALFFIPASFVTVAIISTAVTKRAVVTSLHTCLAGLCEGIALALVLDGLATVYLWYEDPGKPFFEPLFTLLGLASGGAWAYARHIRSLSSTHAKRLEEE
ncbi:MAG: hypothetical protein HGA83_08200 [Bacteroidales bacterium]|nr:hypothetical protein [Bacteroidales bacterium]